MAGGARTTRRRARLLGCALAVILLRLGTQFPHALAEEGAPGTGFLPEGHLFEPPLADLRWPHFSFSFQRYSGDPELRTAVAVSFGESIGLYRGRAPFGGSWQAGVQAAVFSVFDLESDSFDLVNSDFIGALPFSLRWRSLSLLGRVLHQSSHLGDEYLLRRSVDRVNLSYESADLWLAVDLAEWLRLYGGGMYILRREPAGIGRASVRYGFEVEAPRPWSGGKLRPVAGVVAKQWEEHDWSVDISLRAGLLVEKGVVAGRHLVLALEHFRGHSPHGQFYDRSVRYTGLGAHFFF